MGLTECGPVGSWGQCMAPWNRDWASMGFLKKLEEGLGYEMSQSMTTGALELFWLRKAGTIA